MSINKESFLKSRLIPALIMLIALVALLVLTRYSFYWSYPLYQSSLGGFWAVRAIALIFVFIFAYWIFFEVSLAFLQHKIYAAIQALLLNSLMFLGTNFLNLVITSSNISSLDAFELRLWTDWQAHLMLLVNVLIFIIFRIIIIKNVYFTELFLKALLFLLTSLILSFFIKTFLFLNTVSSGLEYILLFILIAVSSDIGGYFGGKYLGHKMFKNKMAPLISSKKTWEGAFVGYVAALIISFVFIYAYFGVAKGYDINTDVASVLNSSKNTTAAIVILLTLAPIAAITGDLYFSFIKRKLAIKDFSRILAGHGGIVDRIDSISLIFFIWTFLALFRG
ncbi:phosphatidate cytidylyltransferase [Mycoplasma sp. 394]